MEVLGIGAFAGRDKLVRRVGGVDEEQEADRPARLQHRARHRRGAVDKSADESEDLGRLLKFQSVLEGDRRRSDEEYAARSELSGELPAMLCSMY